MINELIKTNEAVVTALGWTLFHSIWQISIIALLVAFFLRLNKSAARTRYNVLAGTILLIPILSVITFFFYFESSKVILNDFIFTSLADLETSQSSSETIIEQLSAIVNNYSSLIVVLWFSGILILLIRFGGGLYYTNQLRKEGLISIDENTSLIVDNYRRLCGIKRHVKIFESVLIKIPVTIGYLRPLILLPAGTIAGIPPSQLEAILAHEIAHIKRFDYLQNLINTLIEIIFFYHPAIWWITDRINEERENCCDDIAISITGDSAGLARALAGFDQTFNNPQHILAMTGKQNHLLKRIKRLAGIKESTRKLSYHSYGFLIITTLVGGIAISVNASVQMPDSLMKTSQSITANNHLIDISDDFTQDTLKTKKKRIPAPAKAQRLESSGSGENKRQELSEKERAKLEAEMEKLAAEMKKLEQQMRDLHKQLGRAEWDKFNFDFKFDFDMDSLNVIINEDLAKELALVRVYTDKAKKEAEASELRARALSKAHLERARADVEAAGRNIVIIEKDIDEKNASGEKSKIKAKKLKMKAESNQLEEELRKDGLISGEHFNLKIDNSGMYIDGKKQSDTHYQKYRKIIISDFDDEDAKYLDDSKFNIQITK